MSINNSHVFFKLLSLSKRQFNFIFMVLIITVVSFNALALESEQTKIKQIAQLSEYVGVDYVAAVGNGEILDPDEYQEMSEFSHVILEQASQLSSQTTKFDTVKSTSKSLAYSDF